MPVNFPLVKGVGDVHRICDAMRTGHPPSPLRKGEVKVSTSILLLVVIYPYSKNMAINLEYNPKILPYFWKMKESRWLYE